MSAPVVGVRPTLAPRRGGHAEQGEHELALEAFERFRRWPSSLQVSELGHELGVDVAHAREQREDCGDELDEQAGRDLGLDPRPYLLEVGGIRRRDRGARTHRRRYNVRERGKFPATTIFYGGSVGGCHRGRRRAPASSMPSTTSASSAASITTDDNRPSPENVGRKRPFSRRLVHMA
jgi:hypothetical protein